MAQSLVDQHPDVTKITWKWGRWQHHVDYSAFRNKNRLRLRPGVEVPEGTNNYGMKLIYVPTRERSAQPAAVPAPVVPVPIAAPVVEQPTGPAVSLEEIF